MIQTSADSLDLSQSLPELAEPRCRGFHQAIVENVWDDAPRLIFADWLEENGWPVRAEIIRLGCQLAQKFDGPAQARYKQIKLPEVPRPVGVNGVVWHRGFPAALRIGQSVKEGDVLDLLETYPLEGISLMTASVAMLARVRQHSSWKWIRDLEMTMYSPGWKLGRQLAQGKHSLKVHMPESLERYERSVKQLAKLGVCRLGHQHLRNDTLDLRAQEILAENGVEWLDRDWTPLAW